MAKSKAGTEINRVDLMMYIKTVGFCCCNSEKQIFSIYKKYEGWTGKVWRWIFFSHGFQLAFTFKTVFKALDRDLHFVQYCI